LIAKVFLYDMAGAEPRRAPVCARLTGAMPILDLPARAIGTPELA